MDVDAEKLAEDLVIDLEALLAARWDSATGALVALEDLPAVPLEVWARRNGLAGPPA